MCLNISDIDIPGARSHKHTNCITYYRDTYLLAWFQCVGKGFCCPAHVTNFCVVPTLRVSLMPHSDIIVSCTYIFWPQEVSITKRAEHVVSSSTPDNLKQTVCYILNISLDIWQEHFTSLCVV